MSYEMDYMYKKIHKEKKAKIYKVNSSFYDGDPLDEFVTIFRGEWPVAIYGSPGTGKSYFVLNAVPRIYKMIYNVVPLIILFQPYLLKNIREAYEVLHVKDNTTVWVLSNISKIVTRAIKEQRPVLVFIDEFNRTAAHDQNIYLSLLGDYIIPLENSGEELKLPAYSKIVLMGNTGIAGVSKNEAVEDRINEMKWPGKSAELQKKRRNSNYPVDVYDKIDLITRKLPSEIEEKIIDEYYVFHSNVESKIDISDREIDKICDAYRYSPNIDFALTLIKKRFARLADIDEPNIRRNYINASMKLQNILQNP